MFNEENISEQSVQKEQNGQIDQNIMNVQNEQIQTNLNNDAGAYGQASYGMGAYNTVPIPEVKPVKKKKSGPSFFKKACSLVLSAVLFGSVAGGTMYGVNYTAEKYFGKHNPSAAGDTSDNTTSDKITTVGNIIGNLTGTTTDDGEKTTNNVMNVEAVAKATLPAMVEITGTVSTSTNSLFGYGGTSQATSSGTGVIVGKNDTELLVVTNAHVVDEVNNLKCVFVDGQSISCTVKGSKSNQDIAVVSVALSSIPESTKSAIAIAELAGNANLTVGQSVVAIGNALGEGQSVTTGVISALNRSITIDGSTFTGLILTDAAINSGNSGGALLNADGKVIGINFAKTSTSRAESMGYSIPVSNVNDIIGSIMNKQTREKVSAENMAYLGIAAVDITKDYAQYYNYPEGILIRTVASGSAAEEAGLEVNDIIVGFDDTKITTMTALQEKLQYYSAGEKITIEYYRLQDNKFVLRTATVVLGKKI